jgi:hypothetical protein
MGDHGWILDWRLLSLLIKGLQWGTLVTITRGGSEIMPVQCDRRNRAASWAVLPSALALPVAKLAGRVGMVGKELSKEIG